VHLDVWLFVVFGAVMGAVGFLAGTVVEGRRRSRAERTLLAECRRKTIRDYVARQSRSTSLEERVLAERVADALASVEARTAAAIEHPGAERRRFDT
jgi:hypothetical protein